MISHDPGAEETALITVPFGRLALRAKQGFLEGIDFVLDPGPEHLSVDPLLQEVSRQIHAYLDDPRISFDLPLSPLGTPYRQRVWRALADIPPGRAETYGSLARRLGSGARAVASACRANPYPIVVPCHRVIAMQGLGGYCGHIGGPYSDIKRWLLRHEECGFG